MFRRLLVKGDARLATVATAWRFNSTTNNVPNDGTATTKSTNNASATNTSNDGDVQPPLTPERRYWLKTLLNAASTKFLNSEEQQHQAAAAAGSVPQHTLASAMRPPIHEQATAPQNEGKSPVRRAPATSVSELLAYNKKWSQTIHKIDPTYFADLAKQQTPKFLWIGCADSRVPANQILGLAPGEVFVHRNVANIVSRSDLNCLSVVQFGVEHLKVEQLLVVGHYGCGGVTAAYKGLQLGLVDNWVSNIADIKYRNEALLARVPEDERIDALCDLNAITQALNVAESNVVQSHWKTFREEQQQLENETNKNGGTSSSSSASSPAPLKQPLDIHGWCYGLKDGLVHPLVSFGAYDDVRAKAMEAMEAAVNRRTKKTPLVEGL